MARRRDGGTGASASVDPQRRDEVERLTSRASRWAAARPDVAALALVGSWARGAARPDSDVDLVLLTADPAAYLRVDGWAGELAPGSLVVATRPWGAVTERRLRLPSGLEVGVATPAWASVTPLDPGTRRVVTDGLVPLHDPGSLLATVVAACARWRA